LSLPPYQIEAVRDSSRFTWNCWARQTGKSFTFSLRRLLRGLSRRRHQIILSAGERQSREVMQKIRQHCVALKIWHEFRGYGYFRNTSFRQLEVRLPRGLRVIGLPANPLTARGFSGDVLLDEFAMHGDDEAIWSALFPTVLRQRGELDVASTPRGCRNMFYQLRRNSSFARRTVRLDEAVAQGLDVDVAALRAGISDDWIWRQEFECEFIDESTSFMPYDLIRRCQDVRLAMEPDWDVMSRRDANVYLGVDIGRYRDLTVIWAWQQEGESFVARGVVALPDTSFTDQEAHLTRWLEMPAVRRCRIDATGLGMQLAEGLVHRFGDHRVESVTFTAPRKAEWAGRLRVLAERGRIAIPADASIADDWHSIRREPTDSGHSRLAADRAAHGHGDRFWAAALGLAAADGGSSAFDFVTSSPLRFARKGIW
jgi:phage FluMu gp28-like protein